MRRRLFTILSTVSLALCAATCVLWARSFFLCDNGYVNRQHFRQQRWTELSANFESSRGEFLLRYEVSTARQSDVDWGAFPDDKVTWDHGRDVSPRMNRLALSDDVASSRPILGFASGLGEQKVHGAWKSGWQREVIFPDAALFIAFAFMPIVWIAKRKWQRRDSGKCRNCGYDLRASPERCPECGKSREDAMARR
jgi:hypothetical protein